MPENNVVKLTPWMLSVAAFLIISALAIGFIMKKVFAQEPVRAVGPATETVPMALSDIAPGTTMQSSYLGDGPVLKTTIREHRDIVRGRSGIVGRVAKERIPMATPLRLSMFYPIGSGPEIDIAVGKRLVSVDVGGSTGTVSGLVKAGRHVDVLMTVDRRSTNSTSNDAMVLQLFDGVRVFAVNRNSNTSARTNGNEVVLELSPEQQKIMILAKEKGRISLSYNPQGPGNGGLSIHTSRSDRVMLSEILGTEERPLPEPKPFITEQYRNGGHTNAYYDHDGNPVQYRDPTGMLPGNDTDRGGVPLQQNGGSGWFSTDADRPSVEPLPARVAAGS